MAKVGFVRRDQVGNPGVCLILNVFGFPLLGLVVDVSKVDYYVTLDLLGFWFYLHRERGLR